MEATRYVFSIGGLQITSTVITTWGLLLVFCLFSWLVTRRLVVDQPGLVQTALEGVVQSIEAAIDSVSPGRAGLLLPFVGTLWLFVAVANLVGIIPLMHSPTGDLSTTAALALLVFLSVHWYGIRSAGLKSYLRHYLAPSPILLPFHLLGELSRTIALAMRLFGNIMSLEMAALLVLLVAGLLVPVPVFMLHVVEALVQAYIFGTLALIYIAGGMQSHEASEDSEASQSNTVNDKKGNAK
ncbi:MAG: F0F1 ATP synthase subunit A [Propionivibrio sp.]|nr:F0F1 ATP synthase subunit A [Propionivibrio sp.]